MAVPSFHRGQLLIGRSFGLTGMDTRVCRTCGQTKNLEHFAMRVDRGKIGVRRVCKDCQNEYFRTLPRRGSHNDKFHTTMWIQKNPQKKRAEGYFEWNVLSGKIQRQPCVICGNTKSHAHHPDYSRRLFVAWLCPKHHGMVHSGRVSLLPSAFCDYANVQQPSAV